MQRLLAWSALARFVLLALPWTLSSSPARAEPLQGAGATFPAPLYLAWAKQYGQATGVEIRYEPVGSGAGTARVTSGLVDFGASDIPLTAAQLEAAGLMQFPAVIGGVVPVVNIDGIGSSELRLSGAVLADIYLGRIRKWNAPAIAALNPGLHLPSANITVVHRSDASGSTFLWSRYLALASADWTAAAAPTIVWPLGVAAIGNDGVASTVQRTRMSIGYVEYAYARAHGLRVASLRNRDGEFVAPGMASFRAAMNAAWLSEVDPDELLIDEPGTDSWPITAASFVLLRTTADAAERNRAVISFFDWAFVNGQRSVRDLDYLSLPDAAVAKVRQNWPTALREGR